MLQTRGVVGGLIKVTGQIVVQCHVTMVALMKGLETKEGGSRFDRSGGPFALPVHRAEVVGAPQVGTLAEIKTLSGGFGLDEAAD